jgi:hypothetical protein
MELEGWKLLLLCRLSPMIPYTMINIVMASTRIHFWPFAIVSFFGARPARSAMPTKPRPVRLMGCVAEPCCCTALQASSRSVHCRFTSVRGFSTGLSRLPFLAAPQKYPQFRPVADACLIWERFWGPGSLTENISSIVTGEGEAHGKLTYILAGITMGLLLLTAGWATLIIRRARLRCPLYLP